MPDGIETGSTEEVAGDAGQQANEAGKDSAVADGQQGTSQGAAGNQNDEVVGLKAAATAERVKRQEAEAAATQLQQQMQIMNANAQQSPQGAAQAKPTSLFMQAAQSFGFDPEYMTPAETGQVMDTLLQYIVQNQQSTSFDASHSDFKDVVGSVVGGVFQPSEHLLKVYESNPGLQQAFGSLGLSPNTKLIAYRMVVNSPEYQAAIKTADMTDEQKTAAEAEAKIAAANGTASISSVPGSGNLDRSAALVAMTDAELRTEVDKKIAEAT